jgi:hypothetical protein
MPDPIALENAKQEWHKRHQSLQAQLSESTLMESVTGCRKRVGSELPELLKKLRSAGYAFAADLEPAAEELGRRVARVESEVSDSVRRSVKNLSWKLDELREHFRRLDVSPADATPALQRLGGDLDHAKNEFDQLKKTISESLGDVPEKGQELVNRITELMSHVQRASGACFHYQNEALFLAVPAEWKKTGKAKEDPDGILHVTDRRLIFERKEKEGGFLGIGGEKKQEVVWEIPWNEIDLLRPEQRGLLGGIDLIHIQLKPGAKPGTDVITVEVKGGFDADQFAARLKPALEGRLDEQRVGAAK